MRVSTVAAILVAVLATAAAGQDAAPGAAPQSGAPGAEEAPERVPVRKAGRWVHELVASADGSRIAASTVDRLFVWDAGSAKPVLALDRDEEGASFNRIGISADGAWVLSRRMADGVDAGEVADVWPVAAHPQKRSFGAVFPGADGASYSAPLRDATFEGPLNGLVLFHEGLAFSVAMPVALAGGVDLREQAVPGRPALPRPTAGPVRLRFAREVSFAPDGTSVAVASADTLHLLTWPALEERWQVARPGLYGFHPWAAAGGAVVLLDTQRTVREGGLRTNAVYESAVLAFDLEGRLLWERPKAEVLAVSRAPGRVEAVLSTPGPEIVDARTGKRSAPFPSPGTGTVGAVAFSADGRHLWAARRQDGEIRRHDVPDPAPASRR